MPELPEVETIVRDLKPLEQKTFLEVKVQDAFVLRQKPSDFIRRLLGQKIQRIMRRGKAIIFELESHGFLVVQVMMTGQLIINGLDEKHSRVSFGFTDGTRLLYNDQRRFGQLRVVKQLDEVKYFTILGPEPFAREFTPEFIFEACSSKNRPIKNVLLDHTFVAGIGNIYACEILFYSRISPKRPACRVKKAEAKILHDYIVKILKEAISHRGSSMRNYRDAAGQKGRFNQRLAVYAREGEPCPRCQRPVLRIIQAGRSTFYCGHCQK